jgi:Cys-rich protein (TIGR01571 family)
VAAVSKTETDPHGIPTGHWRDGLCDCCAHGLFHIHYWMAYFCRPVALGQILSRMNLSIWGEPLAGNNQQGSKTLSIMIVLTFLYWTLGQAVNVIGLAILFFTIFVTMKARAHVRRTYNIPESRDCIGCEDFCCSFWCGCCVLAQMSRHTVDYRMYHPVCCTESGMDIDAPPTIPKDPIVEVNADIV